MFSHALSRLAPWLLTRGGSMTLPFTSSMAVTKASTTTAREHVSAFLSAQARAYCDACVARALRIDPSTAYRVGVGIARSNGFVRQYGACSACGDSRFVTSTAG
jgi:hypothetical protein